MRKGFILFFAISTAIACRHKKADTASTITPSQTDIVVKDTNKIVVSNEIEKPAQPKLDTVTVKKVNGKAKTDEKKEAEKEERAESLKNMAKDLCECMQPVEKELTPKDIEVLNNFAKDANKDMLGDSAALASFKQSHQKELFALMGVFMRLQKHMQKGAPAFSCMETKKQAYGDIGKNPTKLFIAKELEKNGCKFLAAINKMGMSKF
jgi:hypothetical protein